MYSSVVIRGGRGPYPYSWIASANGVGSKVTPWPYVSVSRCRTVIGRSAGTVSSNGASGASRTRGEASSDNHSSTGSSNPNTPSATSCNASTPPTSLLSEAIRIGVSTRICSSDPNAVVPVA